MSAGRSIATDLPTPSGTKLALASLEVTFNTGTREFNTGTRESAAPAGTSGASAAPNIRPTSAAVRISAAVDMSTSLRSSRCDHRAHAETHHIDGVALALVVFGFDCRLAGVGDAAQRERQRAGLPRQRYNFHLAGRLLELLVDRQHADVGEDGLAGVHFDAGGLFGLAVAFGEHDVDVIVRQD